MQSSMRWSKKPRSPSAPRTYDRNSTYSDRRVHTSCDALFSQIAGRSHLRPGTTSVATATLTKTIITTSNLEPADVAPLSPSLGSSFASRLARLDGKQRPLRNRNDLFHQLLELRLRLNKLGLFLLLLNPLPERGI